MPAAPRRPATGRQGQEESPGKPADAVPEGPQELRLATRDGGRSNRLGGSCGCQLRALIGPLWPTNGTRPKDGRAITKPQAADLGLMHGAGDGNRTRALSLGSSCSTIKLHPRNSASDRGRNIVAHSTPLPPRGAFGVPGRGGWGLAPGVRWGFWGWWGGCGGGGFLGGMRVLGAGVGAYGGGSECRV